MKKLIARLRARWWKGRVNVAKAKRDRARAEVRRYLITGGLITGSAALAYASLVSAAQAANTNFEATLFKSTGSNTARNVADRFADIKNVLDFGATGNGVTDDTVAVQATVNWQTSNVNRATVFFPDGRYIVSAPIQLPQGSFNIRGSGNGSAILGGFNGFIFDQLSTPYGDSGSGIVIEKLDIVNGYAGQNALQSASSSWVQSASPVMINVPSLPSFVAANCLVYILDQTIAPMPVFVGITSSVVAGTSITLSSTAVGSSGHSNLALSFVQTYAASASWVNGATTITMPGSPPSGVPTGGLIYDYDRILLGDGTVQNVWLSALGVGTWSGSTLTFTEGVNQGSVGSTDRLIFAPLSGCVRLSSTVSGTIRDCVMQGFFCITTSEDDVNSSGQQRGAESYSIVVQGNSLSNAANAASIGSTAIYLTNNSISICNDLNAFWCGTRISGIANSIIAGRCEVCSYGIILGQGQNQDNPNSTANLLSGFSMESNAFAIVQTGGHAVIQALNILCQNSNGQYGLYTSGGNLVIEACSIQGNWQGYGVYIPDVGNTPALVTFISTTVANNFLSNQGWRLPSQSWWGTCIQCNNPPLVYTFSKLTGVGGNPAATEGDEYNISDGTNGLNWGDTVTNTGTHTTHYKVRWNGSNWTAVGK